MIRETSKKSYREIKENGLLSRRRFQVYKTVYKYGPMTGGEIFERLKIGRANSNISARLNELRKMGVVKEVGNKICESTSMTVILWDATSNLPSKLPERIGKVQRLKKKLTKMTDERDRYKRLYKKHKRLNNE